MIGKYKLEGKIPVRVKDLMEWATAYEEGDRRVALDNIEGNEVSTVFLGLDMNHSGIGAPHLFETMVFLEGPDYGIMDRYSTWEEAEEGHKRIVAIVTAQVQDAQKVSFGVIERLFKAKA